MVPYVSQIPHLGRKASKCTGTHEYTSSTAPRTWNEVLQLVEDVLRSIEARIGHGWLVSTPDRGKNLRPSLLIRGELVELMPWRMRRILRRA